MKKAMAELKNRIKLYVVRHAESVGNELGIIDSVSEEFNKGLSVKGRKQARGIGEILRKNKYDLIIVSPLKRIIETLEPHIKSLGNPQVIISDLTIERNAGEFIGKESGAIKIYCEQNKINDPIAFRPANGESILAVYKRARKFLKYLKTNFDGENILLCGHYVFLKCLEIAINNKNIRDYYSFPNMKNCELKEYEI